MFQCKQLLIFLLVCNLAWFGVAVGPIQVIVPQSASENGASPTIFYPRVRRHSAISIEDVVQVHVAKKRRDHRTLRLQVGCPGQDELPSHNRNADALDVRVSAEVKA